MEWPMKMLAWQRDDGTWTCSDNLRNPAAGGYLISVLVYPVTRYQANSYPQPMGSITVVDGVIHATSLVMRLAPTTLPDGTHNLYAAPQDEAAIRQSEREKVADWLLQYAKSLCESCNAFDEDYASVVRGLEAAIRSCEMT